ncbi:MAG: aldose epimerase family protein [Erysipelotrichaceae bacterium]|nr:aldose epimerase family protein [Erysipelotrichaceae bacterium]
MIYTLENDVLKIDISSIGCTIVKYIDKKTNTDIVLGFETEKEYLEKGACHFGACVGRCANRIKDARFTLNGEEYHLTDNDGGNTLHSGSADLSFKDYELVEYTKDKLSLKTVDEDGHGGFPGNLEVIITYELKDNELTVSFEGESDKDTIFNFTNHSYFNLNGKGDILNDELRVYTDKLNLANANVASEEVINVRGTSFDFLDYKKIGDNLKLNHPNLSNGGIDHNYYFENMDDKKTASYRNDKLELEVYSDMPGMQVYTANYVDNVEGKYNQLYQKFGGICFESQFCPNSINYDKFIKPVLNKNTRVKHYIRFVLNQR